MIQLKNEAKNRTGKKKKKYTTRIRQKKIGDTIEFTADPFFILFYMNFPYDAQSFRYKKYFEMSRRGKKSVKKSISVRIC